MLQIHAVDKRIVSRIVTNQMLYKKSLPTSDHVISMASSTLDAITPGYHDINVQFDLSSLLCNSRCLVMMISAFCRNQGWFFYKLVMHRYTLFKTIAYADI